VGGIDAAPLTDILMEVGRGRVIAPATAFAAPRDLSRVVQSKREEVASAAAARAAAEAAGAPGQGGAG